MRWIWGMCLIALAGAAPAGALYKCKGADGRIKLQDKACGADTALETPRLLPPPAAAPEPGAETPPEVLYRLDPATGQLVPVAVQKAPEKPKNNFEKFNAYQEQEAEAAAQERARRERSSAQAVEQLRQGSESHDAELKREEAQRAYQQCQVQARYEKSHGRNKYCAPPPD